MKEDNEKEQRLKMAIVENLVDMYGQLRMENFRKWIKTYPKEWFAICEMSEEEITPKYAEEVMRKLIESNIIELQLVWLLKCGNKMTLNGKANDVK